MDINESRIYVACLASYNAGTLHGAWIEVDDDADALKEEIATMLKASPEPNAEEYAIHDHEGFGALKISEFESLEIVVKKASFITEHREIGAQVLGYHDDDFELAHTWMEERYRGVYDDLAHFAEESLDGCITIEPASLASYFDYAKLGRDMDLGGDIVTFDVDGKIHVFDSH